MRTTARAVAAVAIPGLVVVFALAVALGSGGPVAAKCPTPGPPRGDDYLHYYHDGLVLVKPSNGGIYAKLYNTSPWVEPPTGDRFAAAWVGINVTPGYYLWAQIGWLEFAGGLRYDYYEYYTQDAPQYQVLKKLPPQPLRAQTYYAVLYDPTTRYLTFQINGATVHHPQVGWVPNVVKMSGEINTLASQMPGGYGDHMVWRDTHVWYSGGWQTPRWGDWTTWNEGSAYFANWPHDYSDLDIWDWSCYD